MTRLLALVWPALRAPEGERALFDAMLDRLDDLSPRVEAVDRGVALVDIMGLGPLLGEERRIAARAVALTREVAPLPVRAGVGDNRWLAVGEDLVGQRVSATVTRHRWALAGGQAELDLWFGEGRRIDPLLRSAAVPREVVDATLEQLPALRVVSA